MLRCRLAGDALLYQSAEKEFLQKSDTDRGLIASLGNSEPEVGEWGIRLAQPVPGISLNSGARVLLLGLSALFVLYFLESSAPRPKKALAESMAPGLLGV